MKEKLTDRLDRLELEIKSIHERIDKIKRPDINKKDVNSLIVGLSERIDSAISGINFNKTEKMIAKAIMSINIPKSYDDQQAHLAVKRLITKEFITELYRGK